MGELDNVQNFCEHFIADVVPKSEVEKIFEEIDKLTTYRGDLLMLSKGSYLALKKKCTESES